MTAGLIHRLNEVGYAIAVMGEPERAGDAPASGGHDPPKAFRVDRWTPDGSAMEEYVAGVSDYQVAVASYNAAATRWPNSAITLRQGPRVLCETGDGTAASQPHSLGMGKRPVTPPIPEPAEPTRKPQGDPGPDGEPARKPPDDPPDGPLIDPVRPNEDVPRM
jgi:hypothetical protein